jgi:hypothetical protein
MTTNSKPVLLFLSRSILVASCNLKENSRSDAKFSGMDMQKILSPAIANMLSAEKEENFPIEIRFPEDRNGVVQVSDVIDSVWYVKLGDTPSDLMSDFLQNMEIHDGGIYMKDATQKHVYVFETNGNFLYFKYPLGDGSREFRKAGSIAVDRYQNQLVIHDDGLSKVLYYTLDREFIREQKVGYRFLHFAFINDTPIAVDLNKTYNDHLQEISNNQLVLSDTAWKVLAKGGDYNAEMERELFFIGEVHSRSGDRLFYLRPFTYTVCDVDKDKLVPYCQLDFGKRTLPEDVNFSYTNPRKFAEKGDDYCFLVDNGHFFKRYILFQILLLLRRDEGWTPIPV